MSDDSVEQKEIPSEVGQVVEEAIDKIYNMLSLNDPDARQHVVALIRSYIEGKYFSTPQSFLLEAKAFSLKLLKGEIDPEALRTITDDYVKFAKAQSVNLIDSINKGEVDTEVVTERLASVRNVLADSGVFFHPPRRKHGSSAQGTTSSSSTTNIAANGGCRRPNLSGKSSRETKWGCPKASGAALTAQTLITSIDA